MPSTSAIAKKSTSAVRASAKESNTPEPTPTRISSRVRKEKFSVKDLFNTKDNSSDDSPVKKTPKKKVLQVEVKTPVKEPIKESKNPPVRAQATSSKVTNVKIVNTAKSGIVKKYDLGTPGTSKSSDIVKTVQKNKSGKSSEDKVDLFTESNIESVLENPSALGLEVVVTKLSDNDNNSSEESGDKNVVTIAKVMGGSTVVSKAVKVVPMKPDEKINPSKEKTSIDNIQFKDKGVTITPKVTVKGASQEPKSVTKQLTPQVKKLKSSVQKNKTEADNILRKLDTKLDVKTTDSSSHIVSLKSVESLRKEQKPAVGRVAQKVEVKGKQIPVAAGSPKPQRAKRPGFKDSAGGLVDTNGVRHYKTKRKNSQDSDLSSEESGPKRFKRPSFDESDDGKDFERHFETRDSYVEHDDSLDSESSDYEEGQLAHFISSKEAEKQAQEETTIYDLMNEVSLELPAWNLHILQDTGSFLISQVVRGPHGLPLMNKMIELEPDFNAKVYVNQIFHREFCGVYNSYEGIRDLIIQVNQL